MSLNIDEMMLRKLYRKEIHNIIKNFNFKKVKKVMKFLNWKWVNSFDEPYIPNKKELIDTALRLINKSIDELFKTKQPYITVASGGFKVTIWKYTDEDMDLDISEFIKLEFILEEW